MARIKFKDRNAAWDFVQETLEHPDRNNKQAYTVNNSDGTVTTATSLSKEDLQKAKEMGADEIT